MKYYKSTIVAAYLLLLQILFSNTISAHSFHSVLNKSEGLASNKIYCAMVDHLGYLWLGTPKGVYRYNGYKLKEYNYSTGLGNEDVWHLYEDKRYRIWLGSFSAELGYLYNDKYHKVAFRNIESTIYPRRYSQIGDNIQFWSPRLSKDFLPSYCVVSNNTLYKVDGLLGLKNLGNLNYSTGWKNVEVDMNNEGKMIAYTYYAIYGVTYKNGHLLPHMLARVSDTTAMKDAFVGSKIYLGDYFIFSSLDKSRVYYTNIHNGIINSIDICKYSNDKSLKFLDYDLRIGDSILNIITPHKILQYICRDTFKFFRTIDLDSLMFDSRNNNEIYRVQYDDYWGQLLATEKGLLLYPNLKISLKQDKRFSNLYLLGLVGGNKSLWYDRATFTIYSLTDTALQKITSFPEDKKVETLSIYNDDSLMLFGRKRFSYWFNVKTHATDIKLTDEIGDGIRSFYRLSKQDYLISWHTIGIGTVNIKTNKYNILDGDLYDKIFYDKCIKKYLAINKDMLLITDLKTVKKTKCTEIGGGEIKKIEYSLMDTVHNTLLMISGGNLYEIAHLNDLHVRKILPGLNYDGATLKLYNNKLIVAGKFGVAICLKNKDGVWEYGNIYHNYKSSLYSEIETAEVLGSKLYMRTDSTSYWLNLADSSTVEDNQAVWSRIKIINNYNDSSRLITANDTILLSRNNLRLSFDVINMYGDGEPKFSYRFDGGVWVDVPGNYFTVPSNLVPGVYYKLQLQVKDKSFVIGSPVMFIYITPNWYESSFGSRLLWVGGIVLFVLMIVVVVFITIRVVAAANKRRNMRMEIELKSVYSQINPHFIFNTLNSSLYFIRKGKMTEANDHVMKFSRLLRAYIKSSRDKYILLKDEIENLTNYILLQRVRFDHKFNYAIHVEDNIDVMTTKIPSLLLQPLVENAIDHGLFHKEEVGNLLISFKRVGTALVCEIDDDGVGRERGSAIAKGNTQKPESYGSNLIDSLVDIFNRYENMNIEIQYVDKQLPESGTKVIVIIIKK